VSDVSAVVLTLGEETTDRALASVKAQTLPVEQLVMVDRVRPFHLAFNEGAERTRTPFFVQVDADMVLDPDCIQRLRNAIGARTGIAVGALRDPLMGTIAGVKMFRTSCVETVRLRDTVAPEIDHWVALGRRGWVTECLTGRDRRSVDGATLGAHRPNYTVDYVFGTFYRLGRQYAHREDARALRWRYSRLRSSPHPLAPVGRIAMAHGILGRETRDFAKPCPRTDDSVFLGRLARSSEDGPVHGQVHRLLALATEPLFDSFHAIGASLRATSHASLRACLRALGDIDSSGSLVAEVALGSGALAPSPSGIPAALERLAETWAALDTRELAA
jgi:hypothetical protein